MNTSSIEFTEELQKIVQIELAGALALPLFLFENTFDNIRHRAIIGFHCIVVVERLDRSTILLEQFQDRLGRQRSTQRFVFAIKE